MKTQSKRILKASIISGIVLILLIPATIFGIAYGDYLAKMRMVQNYYYADSESFNEMVDYFRGLYTEGLHRAEIFDSTWYNKNDTLILTFKDDDGYTYRESDATEESAYFTLMKLQEKYQPNSAHPVFSSVGAGYDENGNMWLSVTVYRETDGDWDGFGAPDTYNYIFIYADDGLEKTADDPKPFADNWSVKRMHYRFL